MRSISRVGLVFGLTLLLAVPAFAQQRQRGQGQGRGGRGGGGYGALISIEAVQKELKLDGDQVEKATAAVREVREKHADDFAKLQDLDQQERREKMMGLTKTVNDETVKSLDGILKHDQVKRLKQIELQNRQGGIGAFNDPDVQKALKLTDEQKEKIKTIAADAGEEQRGLRQQGAGADRAEMAKKAAALRKHTMEKVMAVLDDNQKTTWKEMTGAPFEVQMQGGGRRRGAGN
jgi:hypothetical protein